MAPTAISVNKTNGLPSLPFDGENTSKQTGVLFESDAVTDDCDLGEDIQKYKKAEKRKYELVWRSVLAMAYFHVAGVYGVWLIFTSAKWATILFTFLLFSAGIMGVTVGSHRLWSHRSYKAKWPLRLILIIFNTTAYQHSAFQWARDHRVHHKYSETDADPHNATRGLFFSHIGWLVTKKHPNVVEKGKALDITDLHKDRILMFQHRHFLKLSLLGCFILPTIIPMYFWNESFANAWYIATAFRWCCVQNAIYCVNSIAHKFGGRPYDKTINSSESLAVSIFALGEGWHNYHHVFPWDYKAAEWGNYSLNFATAFIDFFAKIGWAYDLKSVAPETIEKRVKRTGDGTHEIWGWGDKDLTAKDAQEVLILNKKTWFM